MNEELPKAIKEGRLNIDGMTLEVIVLDDGRRIIEQQSFINFMDAMANGTLTLTEADLDKLARAIRLGEF